MCGRHCFQLRANYLHTGVPARPGTFIISKADKQKEDRTAAAALLFLSRKICLEELVGFKVKTNSSEVERQFSVFICWSCRLPLNSMKYDVDSITLDSMSAIVVPPFFVSCPPARRFQTAKPFSKLTEAAERASEFRGETNKQLLVH